MAKKGTSDGGAFRFRVSDSLDVPLRGRMLRLKVVDGTPAMADLKPGASLRLTGPAGGERLVRILDHAVTSGRATQQRLDATRELDVVVADDEAEAAGPVGIGWFASGPVKERSDR